MVLIFVLWTTNLEQKMLLEVVTPLTYKLNSDNQGDTIMWKVSKLERLIGDCCPAWRMAFNVHFEIRICCFYNNSKSPTITRSKLIGHGNYFVFF